MKYFIVIHEGYILGIYMARQGANEISEDEYNKIYYILQNCPEAPEGYSYRLKTDLTWELYEQPIEEDDE